MNKILNVWNINIYKLYVVILIEKYFIRFWVCYIVEFLFLAVNGASSCADK
jgi:hypothetical protein